MSFFQELRRRNVFRAGVAYIVSSWIILQVADVVLGNINVPDWVFHVILFVLAIGFPVVLIFAWAFELTPEGIKLEDEVETSEAAARGTRRKLDFAIIGLLVVAVGYFAFDKFVLSAAREAALIDAAKQVAAGPNAGGDAQSRNSIAVLPFTSLSTDPEQEYFSVGLSEELLNLLAKIPALRVIARSSSFAYRDKKISTDELSSELNVDHLLDGSVRKSGNKVRITARVILAEDNTALWSEIYEDELDDIFAVQNKIALAVVDQLRVKLLGAIPTSQKIDSEAYSLYLQARELGRQSTSDGHRRAIDLYKQALAIEPEYAAAWNSLAQSYIFLAERVLSDEVLQSSVDETFDMARRAVDRALQADAQYAPAHASNGRIAMVYDHDLGAAAKHLKRALELAPTNPEIIRLAATLSMNLNRLDQAIALLEYVLARDPVSSAAHANLGLNYFAAGRLEEAGNALTTAISLSPDAVGLRSWLGQVKLAAGDLDAALRAMKAEPNEAWRLIGLSMVHFARGENEESDAALRQLIQTYGAEWPYNIAYVMAYRGDREGAFEWLNKAIEISDPGLSEIVSAPEFENIRSDSKWLPFLHDIGKAPDQLAAVNFEIRPPA